MTVTMLRMRYQVGAAASARPAATVERLRYTDAPCIGSAALAQLARAAHS
jgi:hypothetical protein